MFELHPTYLATLFGGTALAALVALWATLSRKGRSEDEARAYLAGFTYVLSDDADAAIAELSKAAQLNTQTLETYFALGALFIRKGDFDRAIRLHRNMLLRPGLSPDIKRRAQLALALDYRNAGLMEQSAEIYEKLLQEEPDNPEALTRHRHVLEERKQWEKAIELQKRLVALEGKGQGILAHLLSELAAASAKDHPAEALTLADRACSFAPTCAHAHLVFGELALRQQQKAQAAQSLRQAVTLDPELAVRVMPLLLDAMPATEVASFLAERIGMAAEKAYPLEVALALCAERQGDVDAAIAQLRRLIDERPKVWDARKELGRLLLASDRADELRAEYEEILRNVGQPSTGFSCEVCRQKLPEYVFRCPSCCSWNSIRREQEG